MLEFTVRVEYEHDGDRWWTEVTVQAETESEALLLAAQMVASTHGNVKSTQISEVVA